MSIELYRHNRTAYESAVSMLAETGKAAVIHPTGTGKSFIAFKLCEDFPDKRVCWLSPSEYIFKTQIENLKAAGGEEPKNVKFYTYAKLMLMSESELAEIRPDFIILDEFHRCGAEMWGRGVQNLLGMYPNAQILGLSATAIRYLDNQRDMADELFDGNVASEITLGQAIVEGILNPPKYVLSVYSYQKDLEKYKNRVKNAKNKAVRDAAEAYLDALRRALEKADGLDVIFDKHMTDRTGKYIVFCANFDHMREMMNKAEEWFAKVDKSPKIYSVYSDDPTASQSFADFKADNDTTHLRLLYCIDALNEGIHIENISGVILLRPTVSPIIYKQQIGRALSASKKTDAVIFDIVMNIENLCSIDSVEEEMRVAMTYYRSIGREEAIVNEQFRIMDELRDCRELFEKLNDTLTASWDIMYECAQKYFADHGSLDIPRRYRTPEGYSLGNWIFTQRKIYRGEQPGLLSKERIAKLDAIGMIWDSFAEQSWRKNYAALTKYRADHGNIRVPTDYVTQDGIPLGMWLANLRTYRKSGIRSRYLTPEHIADLDELGMIWDVPDYQWEVNYAAAMAYHREHGDLNVPATYVTPNGIRLGAWLNNMRQSRKGKESRLTDEQIARLDEIGMLWGSKYTARWEAGYAAAQDYFEKHGNLNVPVLYTTPNGYRLGKWITSQRELVRTGKMPKERKRRLDKIGMIWEKADPWETRYALAEEFFRQHGNLRMPKQYKVDGIDLCKWISEQRQIYLGNRPGKRLTTEQIERMESIGMDWNGRKNCSRRYRKVNKQFDWPDNGVS